MIQCKEVIRILPQGSLQSITKPRNIQHNSAMHAHFPMASVFINAESMEKIPVDPARIPVSA